MLSHVAQLSLLWAQVSQGKDAPPAPDPANQPPGLMAFLPAIVGATDLAVVMPRNIAQGFAAGGGYTLIEPAFPLRDFTVSLHWSRRFEADPANRWLREVLVELFTAP